jgi:CubicO group peptidase (beta-lactamase class C family)
MRCRVAQAVSATLAQIEDVIQAQMAHWSVPGIAVGIFNNGETETSAYGIASIETRHPLTAETLLQVGSISKVFTTTLLLTAVEEGRIDLDTPILTYVPDLALADETARKTITPRQLVSHMSGFYGDRFDDHGNGDDAIAKAVAAFGDLNQQTAPGELWTYCNAGFDLIGRAIELVLGTGFEQAMRERVFEPLAIVRTTYFAAEAIRHAVAVGHAQAPGEELKISDPWPIPRRSNPAGGISSTVGELLRFARCHMNDGQLDGNRVISSASAQEMRRKQAMAEPGRSWGLGWARREIGDVLIAEHNGGTNGFTARLTTVPARNFAIAVLTNADRGSMAHTKIADAALDRYLGLKASKTATIGLDPSVLARYAGTYKQDLSEITLTVDNGGLHVERMNTNPFSVEKTHVEPLRFLPTGERTFVVEEGIAEGSPADFILNPDGSIRFLRFGGRLAYPAGG